MTQPRSPADIERDLLKIMRPPSSRMNEWKKKYTLDVAWLKKQRHMPVYSSRQVRDGLKKFAKLMQGALRNLPAHYADDLIYGAQSLRDRAARRAESFRVQRSGGQDARDPDRHLKSLVAEFTSDLMMISDRNISQTHTVDGGHYYSAASLLFEAATGRRGVSVENACSRYLRKIKDQDPWENPAFEYYMMAGKGLIEL